MGDGYSPIGDAFGAFYNKWFFGKLQERMNEQQPQVRRARVCWQSKIDGHEDRTINYMPESEAIEIRNKFHNQCSDLDCWLEYEDEQ